MSALRMDVADTGARLGLKGPCAAAWLAAEGVAVPVRVNTWSRLRGGLADVLIARLGASEFFLEAQDRGAFAALTAGLAAEPAGVYPVLREDFAFRLSGPGVHDVLAQACNVDFAGLDLEARPVIMTLMIGVAVLIVPQSASGPGVAAQRPEPKEREYRIWCDPTFGPYLAESLGEVVSECGGSYTGASR